MAEPLDIRSRKHLLGELLGDLLATGGISAGVGLLGTTEEVLAVEAAGRAVEEPASIATPGTLFDLASLTKPVVATLAIVLDERGVLPLDLTVGEIFRDAHPRLRKRRLGQLLRHRSGLAPWTPLFARCETRTQALDLLISGEMLAAEGETYSDLGYILWGFAAEDTTGQPLSQLLQERLFAPLHISNMAPSPGPRPDVAQCRLSNDREIDLARLQGIQIQPVRQIPHGTVQDGNARFLGGMAGHGGLFSTASAMWKLAREWLSPGRVLKGPDVDQALQVQGPLLPHPVATVGEDLPGLPQVLSTVLEAGEQVPGDVRATHQGASTWHSVQHRHRLVQPPQALGDPARAAERDAEGRECVGPPLVVA